MSKADIQKDSEKRLKNKHGRKHRRDTKLQDLEKQLEFAESRCGTLKQQLDYIKILYGYDKTEEIEKEIPKDEGHGDGYNVNSCNYNNFSRWSQPTGNVGDGESPDIMNQTASRTNTTTTNSSNKQNSLKSNHEKDEEPKQKGYSKQKGHMKLLKMKKKNSKKVKKRRRADDASSSKFSNVSSQTQSQSQIWHDPVVEIYKNSAINAESESGLETVFTSKRIKPSEGFYDIKKQKVVTKTSINKDIDEVKLMDDPKSKSSNSCNSKKGSTALKEEGMQTEIFLDQSQMVQSKPDELTDLLVKENSIRTDNCFLEPVKGYCQPTISSKRKQVERDIYSNFNTINIRNIPFIAAKSTAPSHNIGVNIQQVLSTIKNRQMVNDNFTNSNELGNHESSLLALLSSKKTGNKINEFERISETGTALTESSESKRRPEGIRSSLSHWKSSSDYIKDNTMNPKEKPSEEIQNHDWTFKVNKLKRVLVFLHEDFTWLSQKYKRLQKKLTKRNISKMDAKGELADIERDLEKKEEEITVVIGLYKEVLSLKEDLKKLQDKYNMIVNGRSMFEGLKTSNSTHTQMTTLLRKIQNFQDQLKG